MTPTDQPPVEAVCILFLFDIRADLVDTLYGQRSPSGDSVIIVVLLHLDVSWRSPIIYSMRIPLVGKYYESMTGKRKDEFPME